MVSARFTARRSWVQFPGGRACGVYMLSPCLCVLHSPPQSKTCILVLISSQSDQDLVPLCCTWPKKMRRTNFTVHRDEYVSNKVVLLHKKNKKRQDKPSVYSVQISYLPVESVGSNVRSQIDVRGMHNRSAVSCNHASVILNSCHCQSEIEKSL